MQCFKHFALPVAAAFLWAMPAAAQRWDAPPAPPVGAAPNQFVPARGIDGAYATPNRELSAEQTRWHVRAALNVAALGCRDAAEAETVAAYNRMITRLSVPLADADARVKAQFQARFGAAWESEHDRAMTRLYNFFAQPPAHSGFCDTARAVLAEIDAAEPEHFADFAPAALARLEAPFIDFYRAYDAWRADLAVWRSGGAAPATMVAAVPSGAARMPGFP